jgi:hypothetical protein
VEERVAGEATWLCRLPNDAVSSRVGGEQRLVSTTGLSSSHTLLPLPALLGMTAGRAQRGRPGASKTRVRVPIGAARATASEVAAPRANAQSCDLYGTGGMCGRLLLRQPLRACAQLNGFLGAETIDGFENRRFITKNLARMRAGDSGWSGTGQLTRRHSMRRPSRSPGIRMGWPPGMLARQEWPCLSPILQQSMPSHNEGLHSGCQQVEVQVYEVSLGWPQAKAERVSQAANE